MKKCMIILCAGLLLLLASCSFVPSTVARPWSRTLSEKPVLAGSSINVVAECVETPILGADYLVNKEIESIATDLLKRRGFYVTTQNPVYTLKITYGTMRWDETTAIQINESTRGIGSIFSVSGYSGYGVMLAESIGLLAASSSGKSQTISRTYEAYKHKVTCELYANDDNPIWKYDTEANSKDANILQYSKSFLQMAFTGLPSTQAIIPIVPKLKKDKLTNFTNTYLVNKFFICPALPSYIVISTSAVSKNNYEPNGVTSPEALMAYMDLLQTAEYATPIGSEADWKNPTQEHLWRKATLIGKYQLGEDKKPINVVISLIGTPSSYSVQECKLVSDDEYRAHQLRYDSWIRALQSYFQIFDRS